MTTQEKSLIYTTLTKIKPLGYFKGFHLLVTTLETILDGKKLDYDLTNDIFPVVAQIHNCNPKNIERNIRTLILNIDTTKLFSLTNISPTENITVKAFIDILRTYIVFSKQLSL